MYSVRLVCADSYQAAPIPDVDPTFSHFRGSEIKQVPILRIFGITPDGEKVCLHIHGVFPYMYVPYSGQIKADILSYQLATSLDAAINVSLGSARANTQHVYKIQQVSGIPFYGYHKKKHHFLKIYLYNPAMLKRAADLLHSGCILEQSYQPHEAHIPFTQQFMIDYNLYGMSMINLRSVKYRHHSTNSQEGKSSLNSDEILDFGQEEKEYLPYSINRQSVCKIEIDAWASDILNREVIDKGVDLNPGIGAIWEEEKARRAQAGLGGDTQLTYPQSPERSQAANLLTDEDRYQQRRLAQRLATIDSQGDESSLTPNSDNSLYPLPLPDNSHLMNASQLEIHAGPLESSFQRSMNQSHQDAINESVPLSLQSQYSFGEVSLNSSDLDVVNILASLAKDQEDNSIDSNSILGSQKSEINCQDLDIKEGDNIDKDEEEEESSDLNLTTLQLDSLNFSQWEYSQNNQERSQIRSNTNSDSQIELVLESLDNPAVSKSPNNIPQLDGPIDDENARMSANDDNDVTIKREEFVICEYKSSRRSNSVTPSKRKRILSSDDDDSRGNEKKKKVNDCLPKTPRRSPNKRMSKLTSPSCPTRSYSPLSVEITPGSKTPKSSKTPISSPFGSPSARTTDRSKIRESFRRKRIFSPVKESKLEEEECAPSTSGVNQDPLKTSEGLLTPKRNYPESDDTLVEDSDESLDILVPSPRVNPVVINESDSNDSISSKERQSTLSNYNFPHDILDTVPEEDSVHEHELSFSQMIETKQKVLSNQSVPSSFVKDSDDEVTIVPEFKPPTREFIINTMEQYGISSCDNIKPFFSDETDVNLQPNYQMVTNPLQRARGIGLSSLPRFQSSLEGVIGLENWQKMKVKEFLQPGNLIDSKNFWKGLAGDKEVTITPLKLPPDKKSVEDWLEDLKRQRKEEKTKDKFENKTEKNSQKSEESSNSSTVLESSVSLSKLFKDVGTDASNIGVSCGQIEFNTRSTVVDVDDGNLGKAKALTTHQFVTVFCLEVHVNTRPNLLPDPKFDPVGAIFYAIHNDVPPDWSKAKPLECGVIILDPEKVNRKAPNLNGANPDDQLLIYVENEEAMLESLLSIIERTDPEMLIGWDIDILSWGYLFQRASLLGKNLSGKISRIPKAKCSWEQQRDPAQADLIVEYLAEVRLPGRIVLEIWRIMKHELALTSYTYENVMFHVMNERVPKPSYDTLTHWWNSSLTQWRVIDYYTNKIIGIHRMLHHLDIINRTSEHARLYGILFYEVFSRGSQFRVESMMLRLAKPMNYIPVSPTPQQRHGMRAPECLPLIMEPESTMYCDPVVVLDFQSLYPSIIIAYNYCFSTCLGRVEHIGNPSPFEFGCTHLKVQKNLALKLQKKLNIAPCGVAYVKQEVRKGILPQMLSEILETRLMVKKAIKDHPKEDRALQRALHSRQLGLKLIANVTYGYTAANFSGRMPCIEVGDSVVSKGKETLERAIKLVESTPKWGARVIYGDTDSLFVLLKGKSREEAFEIGTEIADAVTAANPKPVKLKFEKVMMPAILQTKKRYCGYMYENLNDKPVYLAKGIETVRRDGCPAVAKILEKTLRILFDTKDLSKVKQYVIRQLDKILSGRASIQDLTFAKEFRGMRGYKAAACVPALELTKRLILKDPRAIPRTGARVPYIIVAGGPNEALIRCVRSPMELIMDPYLRPNATYYISKVIIPPLNRCLNLIGVDAYTWFNEMPHRQALNRIQGTGLVTSNRKQKTTISQYLCNTTCPSCGQNCDKGICGECIKHKSQTLIILHEKCRQYERIYSNIKMVCESCIGVMDADSCISLDCPIFYRRIQAQRDNTQVPYLYDLTKRIEY